MKMVDEDGWMLEFRAENDTKWSAYVVARSPGGISAKKTYKIEDKSKTLIGGGPFVLLPETID